VVPGENLRPDVVIGVGVDLRQNNEADPDEEKPIKIGQLQQKLDHYSAGKEEKQADNFPHKNAHNTSLENFAFAIPCIVEKKLRKTHSIHEIESTRYQKQQRRKFPTKVTDSHRKAQKT